MSTQIGTASDYVDLLQKLDLFLCTTGHAWSKVYAGTGNGDLTAYIGTANSVAETFTITATGASTFTVVGTVSGALANATVGSQYTSAKIGFLITAGTTPFQSGDQFTINTSPPWTRLLRRGWADIRSVTSDMLNVDYLFDGGTNSATRAATTCFVEWAMAAPTRVRRVYARAATASRMPTSLTLQWRDTTNAAWTTVQTFTRTWVDSEGFSFLTTSDPGEHLFWRLEMSGATTSTEVREISLFAHTAVSVLGDAPLSGFFCAWQAPGLDGSKQIICQVHTEASATSDIWNLSFSMARTWSGVDNAFWVQPGWPGYGREKRMLLGITPMGYWFVVNGQRAIVVTAFQGLMQVAYIGFGNAYEPPNIHAYPAIVAAPSGGGFRRFSTVTEAGIRNPFDPGLIGTNEESMLAYYPNSAWLPHANRANSGSTAEGTTQGATSNAPGKVYPAAYSGSLPALAEIVANLDGSRVLIPCVLFTPGVSPSIATHHWGELDGLFWTTGNGTSPQAVIRYDNFDHLIVNNVFRTSSHSFGAVRLD